MPDNQQHTEHSARNLSFLNSFFSKHLYNDWSITVAFYSSVHIIENAIYSKKKLRYQGNEIELVHSDDLCSAIRRAGLALPENKLSISPHMQRKVIVNENFSEIQSQYNMLYVNSRTARYKRYSWRDQEVDYIVKTSLKQIVEWSNNIFKTKLPTDLFN